MRIYVIAHEQFLAWFGTRIAGLVGRRSSTALAGPGYLNGNFHPNFLSEFELDIILMTMLESKFGSDVMIRFVTP